MVVKPKVRFHQYDEANIFFPAWWLMAVERADGTAFVQFLRSTTDECYDAFLEAERRNPYIFA